MKNNTIILASHNEGKVREMSALFNKMGYELISLASYNKELELPEETGTTFEENALIKAKFVAKETSCIALADDSGLEIFVLNNAPGVYSARYATNRNNNEILSQDISKDEKNILQVLKDLEKFTTNEERKARFVCCLALVFPDERANIISHGYWEGIITKECIGENGFGYDPIFYDEKLQKVSAQLSKEEKNAVSHRGAAIKNLLAQCALVF